MQEIKDSGQRTVFENTGFVRDMHEGKGRFDLLPWNAIWEGAKHSENGALKYGERNIDLGAPQHSLIDSAIRHIAKYLMGWDDEPHLRAAWWNISWALEQEVVRPDMQDIPSRMKKEAVLPHDMMEELLEKEVALRERVEELKKEHDELVQGEEKKPTNGDRIRAMSDEELAKLAGKKFSCNGCIADGDCTYQYGNAETCEEAFLKWLKAKAEEE